MRAFSGERENRIVISSKKNTRRRRIARPRETRLFQETRHVLLVYSQLRILSSSCNTHESCFISYNTQPTSQAVGDKHVRHWYEASKRSIAVSYHSGDSRVRSRLVRLVRRAERDVCLIVPNRPARRSATHGPEHGRIRARASNSQCNRDMAR